MFKIFILLSLISLAQNKCTETDIAEHLYWENYQFTNTWEKCGMESWGFSGKTAKCLVKAYPTLSHECSTCFGDHASCLRNHCIWACRSDRGEVCEKCAIDHCREPLETCTGLPYWKLPSR